MPKDAALRVDGVKVKNIMRRFTLDEISAVDRPAQEGAKVMILKRDDPPKGTKVPKEFLEKALSDLLTSVDEDHQHGVTVEMYDDEPHVYVSYAAEEEGEGHSHEVVVQNGEFILSTNQGHTHTLDADMVQRMLMSMMIERKRDPDLEPGIAAEPVGKTQPIEENVMADKDAGNTAEIQKKDDVIAKLQAVLDLSPEHRAHYDGLAPNKQDDYLTLPDAQKSDILAKMDEANPVVFTSSDGVEFRKNDDPRMVDMAKKMDAQAETLAAKSLELDQAEFTKRAETELRLLPGETIHKVALLRAVSKIDDEDVRKGAQEMLVKAAKVASLALDTQGYTAASPTETMSAEKAFFTKAAAIAEEKGVPALKAQETLLDTPEGEQLYAAYQYERKRRHAASGN